MAACTPVVVEKEGNKDQERDAADKCHRVHGAPDVEGVNKGNDSDGNHDVEGGVVIARAVAEPESNGEENSDSYESAEENHLTSVVAHAVSAGSAVGDEAENNKEDKTGERARLGELGPAVLTSVSVMASGNPAQDCSRDDSSTKKNWKDVIRKASPIQGSVEAARRLNRGAPSELWRARTRRCTNGHCSRYQCFLEG